MEALTDLALIWCGVLIAVYLAKRTRLTPVLYFLAVGAVFVNLGVLPKQPHEFVRGFAEIGMSSQPVFGCGNTHTPRTVTMAKKAPILDTVSKSSKAVGRPPPAAMGTRLASWSPKSSPPRWLHATPEACCSLVACSSA
jgi:hypothetical protein